MSIDPAPTPRKRDWYIAIALAVFAINLAALLGSLALALDRGQIRSLLGWLGPRALDLTLFIGVVSLWSLRTKIWGVLKRELGALARRADPTRASVAVFLCIVATLIFLFVVVVPRTNRIFFDEHIYQSIALTIAQNGQAYFSNEADAEHGELVSFIHEYNKQPIGHPYYLSIFFRLLGAHEWVAHAAANVAILIGLLSTCLIGAILFGRATGVLAAGIFAITPMVLLWGNTVAAEPTAVAFSALSVALYLVFLRTPGFATLALSAAASAAAVYVRPESGLILIVLMLTLVVYRPGLALHPYTSMHALLLAILVQPMLLHLFAIRAEPWGTTGSRFSYESFLHNFDVNGSFLFDNLRYPLLFSIAAVVGLLPGKNWTKSCPLLAWFLCCFVTFLFFYAGSYEYGADVRFSILWSVPAALLASLGVHRVKDLTIQAGMRATSGTLPAIAALCAGLPNVLVAAIVFQLLSFFPLIRSVGREAGAARADIEFVRRAAPLLPAQSLVITHIPHPWLLLQHNASQIGVVADNPAHLKGNLFARYPGGLFYHRGYWCDVVNDEQTTLCAKVEAEYELTPVLEENFGKHHLGLYRIALPKIIVPAQPLPPSGKR